MLPRSFNHTTMRTSIVWKRPRQLQWQKAFPQGRIYGFSIVKSVISIYDKIKFSDDGLPMPMVQQEGLGQMGPVPGMKRRRKQGGKINVPMKKTETVESEPTKIRSLFPETWLWDIVMTGLVFQMYCLP